MPTTSRRARRRGRHPRRSATRPNARSSPTTQRSAALAECSSPSGKYGRVQLGRQTGWRTVIGSDATISSRKDLRAALRLPDAISTPTPSSATVMAATAGSSSSAMTASRSNTSRSASIRTFVSGSSAVRTVPGYPRDREVRQRRESTPDQPDDAAGLPWPPPRRPLAPAQAEPRRARDEGWCTSLPGARPHREDPRSAVTPRLLSLQARSQLLI